ncbi:hypothetical protein BpHYR1_049686 [Brachionus plicatilis]|uniref:Uncharacterized protein n=1 Tax=Brachionus plicatilis TaxID=10195 RepID=A0A3M7QL12_BRAPC|nr:hypothetical protein BpHYR1_049686 [Brachionus plicatilis]
MTRPGLLNGHNKLNSHTGEQKDINHLLFYYNIHIGSSFEELNRLNLLHISEEALFSLKKSKQILSDVNTSGDLTSGFINPLVKSCQIYQSDHPPFLSNTILITFKKKITHF